MHLAVIMDGNRRWAKKKGKPKILGHHQGVKTVEKILELCPKYHITHFTIYALSTENLKRSEIELKGLFRLLEKFTQKSTLFLKNQVQVKFIGNLKLLPKKLRDNLKKIERETKKCTAVFFQIAVAYGGRDEILRTIKKSSGKLTEKNFSTALDTGGLPDPDLLIRTGGHRRLSNFLPWQMAYTELYFTDVLWPEFNEKELKKALTFFKRQQRNFGK